MSEKVRIMPTYSENRTRNKTDIVSYYQNLPDPFEETTYKAQPHFDNETEVKSLANELYRRTFPEYGKSTNRSSAIDLKKISLRVAMLQAIPSDVLYLKNGFHMFLAMTIVDIMFT